MEIKPSEVEKIEYIGQLDGEPVRMLKTVGGFWIAIGRPRRKKKDEALAAGSHPAIVKYNVEKNFNNFQPILTKSEPDTIEPLVTGFSELLPEKLRNKGYDMVMIEKSEETSFVLTKYGAEFNSCSGRLTQESLQLFELKKSLTKDTIEFAKAIAAAAAIKALKEGKSFVDHNGIRFDAKKIITRR